MKDWDHFFTGQKGHFITAKELLCHCAKESLTHHCHHHHDWLIHHCQQLVTASSQHHVAAKLHNYLCQLLCHINLINLIGCCLNNLPYCCQCHVSLLINTVLYPLLIEGQHIKVWLMSSKSALTILLANQLINSCSYWSSALLLKVHANHI